MYTMNRTWIVLVIAMAVVHVTSGDVTRVEKRLEALEQQQRECKAEIRHLKEVFNQQSMVKRQVQVVQDGGAFSVYLDALADSVGPGETIRFDKAVTNEGNHYNNGTGMFTCTRAGLYLFSYTVCQVNLGETWADLFVNGVSKGTAIADPYHSNMDIQGTNTVVVRLKAGDLVWVGVHAGVETAICHKSAMFTGVFLRS